KQGRLLAGLADISAGAVYTPGGVWNRKLDLNALSGQATIRLTDATVTSPRLSAPLTHLNGTTTFTTDSLLADLRGAYDGTDFTVSGSAPGLVRKLLMAKGKPLTVPPAISIQGAVASVDLARLLHTLPLGSQFDKLPAQTRSLILRAQGHGSV